MKKMFFVLAFSMSISGTALFAADHCSVASPASDTKKASVKTESRKLVDVNNKLCPVSGDKISPKNKRKLAYNGKSYNLCCVKCIDAFKKNPEKYSDQAVKETSGASNESEHAHHHH